MGHVVSCLSSAVWKCRQRVQVESEDGSDRFESTFDGSTRTPRTTGTTGTTMSMDTGILGMALRLALRLSQESLGCWLMLAALAYTILYIPRTLDPGPSFLSLVWVICMVAGHPTMILALVLDIRSRDSGGVPGRVARSICPFPFPLSPCGVAPVLHRRRMEPRLVVWQIGDTNMQKAGRDGDSRASQDFTFLHAVAETATTVLVTCVTEITQQIFSQTSATSL